MLRQVCFHSPMMISEPLFAHFHSLRGFFVFFGGSVGQAITPTVMLGMDNAYMALSAKMSESKWWSSGWQTN